MSGSAVVEPACPEQGRRAETTAEVGAGLGLPLIALTAGLAALLLPRQAPATMVYDGGYFTYDGAPRFWDWSNNTIQFHKGRFYLFIQRNIYVPPNQYSNYHQPTYFTLVSSPTVSGLKDSLDNNDTCIVLIRSARYTYNGYAGLAFEVDKRTDSAYFLVNACPAWSYPDTAWFVRGKLDPATGRFLKASEHIMDNFAGAGGGGGAGDTVIYRPKIHIRKDGRITVTTMPRYRVGRYTTTVGAGLFPTQKSDWVVEALAGDNSAYWPEIGRYGTNEFLYMRDPWAQVSKCKVWGAANTNGIDFSLYNWESTAYDYMYLGTDAMDTLHMVWRNEGTTPILHARYKPSDTTFYTPLDTVFRTGVSTTSTYVRAAFDTTSLDTFFVAFVDQYNIIHCLRTQNRGKNWSHMKSADPEVFSTVLKYRVTIPTTVYAKADTLPVAWYELVDSTIHVMMWTDTVPKSTWVGQGYTTNWSDAQNWAGGAVPSSTDTAVFNGTCSKNCTMDQNVSVKGLRIATGYQGVITQGANTLTVGTGNFVQSTGTLTGGSLRMTFQGDFTQSGGTFTATSDSIFVTGGTFTRSGGTFTQGTANLYVTSGGVTFDIGSSALNRVVFNTTGDITVTGTMTINDSLIITAVNGLVGGTIKVRKDLVNRCAISGTKTTVFTLDSTLLQNLRQADGAIWPTGALTINKTGGKVVLGSNIKLTGGVTLASGTFDQGAANNCTTGTTAISIGGTWVNRGTGDLVFSGDLTNNGALILNGNGKLAGEADDILVRSSPDGTTRYWTGTGAFSIFDANIKNMSSTPAITAYSSTDGTGNSGFTFTTDITNRFSIGINSGTLYGTGTSTVIPRSFTVDFTGATLPANIGEGDKIIFDFDNSTASGRDTCYILSRNSGSQLTLQTPPACSLYNQDFAIKRAFNLLQDWETDRNADLVTQQVIEKGVCYNDGAFTVGVTIDGSTTDATHYLWLTCAAGQRHAGKRYTTAGVRIELAAGCCQIFVINHDAYTLVEWLQFQSAANDFGVGNSGGGGEATIVRNCLFNTHSGIYVWGSGCLLYNNLLYNGTGIVIDYGAKAYNNTVYGAATYGINVTNPNSSIAKNNIVLNSGTANFNGTFDNTNSGYNACDGSTPPGSNNITVTVAATFLSTTGGSEDLRLKTTSTCVNAGDSVGLSQYYLNDIEDTIRHYNVWDVGADEAGMPPYTWTGNGADSNWTTVGNWFNGASAPGAGDAVYFNETSTKRSRVNAGFGGTVNRIIIEAGYTDSIKLERSLTVTDSVCQDSGVVWCGANKLTMGAYSITGGFLSASTDTTFINGNFIQSGGTVTHNNGTVCLNPSVNTGATSTKMIDVNSNLQTYNLRLAGNGSTGTENLFFRLGSGDTLFVNSAFSISRSNSNLENIYVDSAFIVANGSVEAGGGAYGGTSIVLINNGTAQTYSGVSGSRLPAVEINTAGSFAPLGGTTKFGMSSLILTAGTFTAPSDTLWIGLRGVTRNENIFTHSGGTFTEGSGLVLLDAYGAPGSSVTKTIDVTERDTLGGMQYGISSATSDTVIYQIATGDTIHLTNAFVMAGTSTAKVWANGGAINLMGNAYLGDNARGGTTHLRVIGNAAQTYTATVPGGVSSNQAAFPNLEINTTGSFAPASSPMKLGAMRLIIRAGTFTAPSDTFCLGRPLSDAEDTVFKRISGAVFNHNDGIMFFNGYSATGATAYRQIRTATKTSFKHLHFYNGGAGKYVLYQFLYPDTLQVTGNFTVSGQTSGGTSTSGRNASVPPPYGAMEVQGDINYFYGATTSSPMMILTGSNTQVITDTGDYKGCIGLTVVNKPSGGKVILGRNYNPYTSGYWGSDVYIEAGVFDMNGYSMNIYDSLVINGTLIQRDTGDLGVMGSGSAGAIRVGSSGAWIGRGSGQYYLKSNIQNDGLILLNSFGRLAGEPDSIHMVTAGGTIPGVAHNWSGSGTAWLYDVDLTDQVLQSGTANVFSGSYTGAVTSGFTFRDDTVSYSIGTNNGTLASGTASTTQGSPTVSISTGTSVGEGDMVIFDANNSSVYGPDTCYIQSRVDGSTVTLQIPVAFAYSNEDYVIKRAFNTIQAWATARNKASLVTQKVVEKGVCYNDGAFNEAVSIGTNGVAAADGEHFFWLTAAQGQRHNGKAGTGARINRQGSAGNVIYIYTPNTKVEWLEVTNFSTSTAIRPDVYQTGQDSRMTFRNLLIHNPTRTGAGFYLHSGDNERYDTLINNVFYRLGGGVYSYSGAHFLANNTIYDCDSGFIFEADAGVPTLRNNLALGCNANWWLASDCRPNGGYNVYEPQTGFGGGPLSKFVLNQTANSCFTSSPYKTFIDTNRSAPDLRLKWNTDAQDAADSTGLSRMYMKDAQDTARQYGKWDCGAFEYATAAPPDTNLRSIGSSTATYTTGTATVIDAYTVDFAGGASLPDSVGAGDRLVLDITAPVNGPETCYIASRVSAARVTVQRGILKNHSGQDYKIERAYTTLQAWETARNGDLVAENRLEKGVCYKDHDTLTGGVDIDGSTTDSTRFMWLTSATAARHTGFAGTGVTVDGSAGNVVRLMDRHTRVEWLEMINFSRGVHGEGGNACHSVIRNCIIHNSSRSGTGIELYAEGADSIMAYNNFIYSCRFGAVTSHWGVSYLHKQFYNNTIFDCDTGFNILHGVFKNNIALGCDSNWLAADLSLVTCDYNVGETDNMPPEGGNNQTSTVAGTFLDDAASPPNLHLIWGAEAINMGDSTGLSQYYRDDIDGITRNKLAWDIGADEGGKHPMTWDGGGSTNNWSEANNWIGNVAPTSADTVFFDETSSKQALSNSSATDTVKRIEITDYTDTVKLGQALVVTGDIVQTAGTFYGASYRTTVDGSVRLSGGYFSATTDTLRLGRRGTTVCDTVLKITGGSFVKNTGTVLLDGYGAANSTDTTIIDVPSNVSFYNLKLGNSSSSNDTAKYRVGNGDTLFVTGVFSMEGSSTGLVRLDSGIINAQGNLALGNNARGGGGKLRITGNTTQTYTTSATGVSSSQALFPYLEIATTDSLIPAGGTTKFGATNLILRSGAFRAPSDTFNLGRYNVTVDDTILKVASGAVLRHGNGVLAFNASGAEGGTAIKYIDTDGKQALNHACFNNANYNGKVKYWLGSVREDTLSMLGNVRIGGRTLSSTSLYKGVNEIYGNVYIDSGATNVSSNDTIDGTSVVMTGSSNATWMDSVGRSVYGGPSVVRKSANNKVTCTGRYFSFTVGNTAVPGCNMTIASGILDLNNASHTLRGELYIDGTLIQRGGSVNPCTVYVSATGSWINKTSGTEALKGRIHNDGFIYWNTGGRLAGDNDSIIINNGGHVPWAKELQGNGQYYLIDCRVAGHTWQGTNIQLSSCKDTLWNAAANTGFDFNTLDTVRYSIGTNTGTLHSGTVTACNRSRTVTVGSALAADVGEGDMVIFDMNASTAYGADTCWIRSRDNSTQLTLQLPPVWNYSGEDFEIRRAYNTIQAWEDAAPVYLDSQKVVWKGICYNDGVFTAGATLSGSTCDASHFKWLTVAPGYRHTGQRYTVSGVRIEPSAGGIVFQVRDDFTKIEWIQVKNTQSDNTAFDISTSAPEYGVLSNVIVYSASGYGTGLYADNSLRVQNCLFYGLGTGANIAYGAALYNSAFYGNSAGIYTFASAGSPVVKNCIVLGNSSENFHLGASTTWGAASSNNTGAATDDPPGSGDVFTTAAQTFISTEATAEDFHLAAGSNCRNNADSTGLSAILMRDIDDTLRGYNLWDIGPDECTYVDTIKRSIGMQTGAVYNDAGANAGTNNTGDSVILAAGAFPDSLGEGDSIIVGSVRSFIFGKGSTTAVHVRPRITGGLSGQAISVFRRYNTMQAWNNDRMGNLVVRNAVEKGVAYRDAPFTAQLSLGGFTTDASHGVLLTSAVNQRHHGVSGTGVQLATTGTNALQIGSNQHYIRVEWLDLSASSATEVIHGDQAMANCDNLVFCNLIIHGSTTHGFQINGGSSATLFNCFIYGAGTNGAVAGTNSFMYNSTVIGPSSGSFYGVNGFLCKNVIVLKADGADFVNNHANSDYNLSEDNTAPGAHSIKSVDPFVIIEDTSRTAPDMHLKNGSVCRNAGDSVGLSGLFMNDIDDTIRHYGAWDIGADEMDLHPMTWTGGGSDSLWATGANWAGGTPPGASDSAFFGPVSGKNCVISAATTAKHIEMATGYTGTVYMRARLTIASGTTGDKLFLQAGTLNCGTDTLHFEGGVSSFEIAGGTFVDSTGCVFFVGGTGTNSLTSNAQELYNLRMDKTSHTLSLSGPVIVRHNLTIESGRLNADTAKVYGDFYLNGGTDYGTSGFVLFTGTGNQTLHGDKTASHGCPSIIIDKSDGVLTLQDTVYVTPYWNHKNGTVNPGTSTVGTLAGVSATHYISTAGMSFNNFRPNSSGGWQVVLSSDINVNGDLTILPGASGSTVFNANGYNITVAGGWTNNANFYSGAGTVTFDSNTASTVISGGTGDGQDFQNFTINKSGDGMVRLDTSGLDVDGAFTLSDGVFSQGADVTAGSASVAVGARWVNTGTGDLVLNGNFTNDGTVYMNSFGGGSGDGDSIWIRSTATRTLSNPANWRLFDVNVKNMTATGGGLYVYSCTDSLGNTGIDFSRDDTVSYSIGTSTAQLFNEGTVTVSANWDTLTFSDNLPDSVGEGDRVILDFDNSGYGRDTVVIGAKTDTLHAVLQAPPRFAATGADFTIKRSFNALQSWEDARQKNLVAQKVIEKGVCYNDGIFTSGVVLHTNTSDDSHYLWLTAEQGQRHRGTGYDTTGVRIEFNSASAAAIQQQDVISRIEWVQAKIIAWNAAGISNEGYNGYTMNVRNCIVYGPSSVGSNAGKGIFISSNGKAVNNLVYGPGVWQGIQLTYGAEAYNNTVYGCANAGISGYSGSLARNNISLKNAGGNWGGDFGGSSSRNAGEAGDALPGTGAVFSTAYRTFMDTTTASLNPRLKYGSDCQDAADSTSLSAIFLNDLLDTVRHYGPWDIGAYEYAAVASPDTIMRSIGTNSGVVHGTGTATVVDAYTINFNTNLADSVGPGDLLILNADNASPAGTRETTYVVIQSSATQAAVWPGVRYAHSAVDFAFRRAYGAIQDWETARQGILTTRNTVEKGVCYADGAFGAGASIDGSTTDSTRFLWLTAAPGQRHNGLAGTGVVVNNGNIQLGDGFTVLDGVELNNGCVYVEGGGYSRHVTASNNLIHDYPGSYGAFYVYESYGDSSVYRNNIVYNCRFGAVVTASGAGYYDKRFLNNTFFNCDTGFNIAHGYFRNNIVLGCDSNWMEGWNGAYVDEDYNAGSTGDMPFEGANNLATTAYETFVDTNSASMNLHLRSHGTSIDAGTSLAAYFTTDVDGATRSGAWDLGADEFGGSTQTYATGTNEYTIGKKPDVALTVTAVDVNGSNWDVTYSGTPNLWRIFANDCFNDGGAYKHKWKIVSKDTVAKKITVSRTEYAAGPEPSALSTYHPTVGRWYNEIQKWEDARDGNLVTRNAIEKGVCYNDSAFSVTTSVISISGTTTDATRYVWLTAAAGERHSGSGYTTSGVRIEQGAPHDVFALIGAADGIKCIIEYLQFKPYANSNVMVLQASMTGGAIVRNNIFYAPENGWTANKAIELHGSNDAAYNNLVYGGEAQYGLQLYRATAYNNTVSGCDTGVYTPAGYGTVVRNTLCAGNTADFAGTPGTASYNLSSDATAPGTNSKTNKAAFAQFSDTSVSNFDARLRAGSDAINAGDSVGLSALYMTDIRDSIRHYGKWDIGCFEYAMFDTSFWYVDYRNGVDQSGYGRSLTAPFKHIEYCYDQLPNAAPESVYVINLSPGRHYSDDVSIKLDALGPDFNRDMPLVIRSFYPTTDSMAEVVQALVGNPFYIFKTEVPWVIFDRLHIRGSEVGTGGIGNSSGSCPHNLTIRNCYFQHDSIPGVDHYYGSGILLPDADSILILNNIFIGKNTSTAWSRGFGVSLYGKDNRIINNTFYKLSYALQASAAGTSGLIFANNLFDSLYFGVYSENNSDKFALFNCGLANMGPYYMSIGTGSPQCSVYNPETDISPVLSYNFPSPDFGKLRRGSRFINAGRDTTGVPKTDFHGIDSVARRDIGACEYNGNTDPFYADTVQLYVAPTGNDGNSGRSIAQAKLTVAAAYGVIPTGTVDSTYIINILPGTYDAPYVISIDGSTRVFPSWNKSLVVQSYYSQKDSFAVFTTSDAGGTYGLVKFDYGPRHVHVRRIRFIPQASSGGITPVGFDYSTPFRNIKISECVFDTANGKSLNSTFSCYAGGALFDSIDVFNNISVGPGTGNGTVFSGICTPAGSVYGVRVFNNTFMRMLNAFSGILGAGSARYTVLNNIFKTMGNVFSWNQVLNSNIYVNGNCYYGITDMYPIATANNGPDSLMRDPLILSMTWSSASFGKLDEASPCNGFGKDSVQFVNGAVQRLSPAYDFYGLPRTGGNDLGACQYDPVGDPRKRVFQWEVFGAGYGAMEDAPIDQNGPNTNYGSSTLLYASENGTDFRTLIRFPLFTGSASNLQVPQNAHVDSAFLSLYCTQGGSGRLPAYRVTRSWKEDSVTWNKAATASWGTAGCDSLNDRMPVDDAANISIGTGEWERWTITSLVQDWVSGLTNYGLILIDTNNSNLLLSFPSSEYASKTLRPKLTVYFDPDTATLVRQVNTAHADFGGTDTWLDEANKSYNYGEGKDLRLNSTTNGRNHILADFPSVLGNSPNSMNAGSRVSKAELILYRSNTTSGLDADESKVYGLRQAWTEGVQIGAAGEASWNNRLASTAWSSAGAADWPSIDTAEMATGNTQPTNTIGEPMAWRADTAAQRWSTLGYSYGLAVLPTGDAAADVRFYSAEGCTAVSWFYAPKLKVTFARNAGLTAGMPWHRPANPLLKLYTRVTGACTTLTFRDGDTYGNTDDCSLYKEDPNTNKNALGLLLNDTAGATYAKKFVMAFTDFIGPNPGQVDSHVTIDTAYIRLVEFNNSMDADITVNVYRLNESWTETGVTWNRRNATPTNWTSNAARSPVSATLIYRNVTLGETNWNDTVFIPVTHMVREWVSGAANYGVVVEKISSASNDAAFINSEGTQTSRPQLVVTFHKKQQVEVQSIGRYATENSYFSSADTLKNQFFMSFNAKSDSTDGMMNQFRTAATSPGQKVKLSYELLPDNKHAYNMFNPTRYDGVSLYASYADSVRKDSLVRFTVIESTTTRMRYRIEARKVFDGGSHPRNPYVINEFTIYPTGQVFVWDSAVTNGNAYEGSYSYWTRFTTKDGTGTVTDNDTSFGGVYSTAVGQSSLHDWMAAFLGYRNGSTVYPRDDAAVPFATTPGNNVAELSGSGYKGVKMGGGNETYWNSNALFYEQAYMLDYSRDDITHADTLKKLFADRRYPCLLNQWRTGSLLTTAAGDFNADGFNEREGCYELNTDASGAVYFWFNYENSRTRYTPVFKMNGFTGARAPTYVMLMSEDERIIDTCFASRNDVNISLNDAGDYVVFQVNRVIDGPVLIFCSVDPNLAVEMNSFTGAADSGECRLYWTTESEMDNMGFTLLRRVYPAAAGKAPKAIAGDTTFRVCADYTTSKSLMGMLTKATRTDYEYADRNVVLGVTYEYALVSVDRNGAMKRYDRTVVLTVDRNFGFELSQNYPNPFNPVTVIKYTVPGKYSIAKQLPVQLKVFDIRGRLVRNLVDDRKAPQTYRVVWDGKANNGRLVASGLYVYRIQVGSKWVKSRKMIVVK